MGYGAALDMYIAMYGHVCMCMLLQSIQWFEGGMGVWYVRCCAWLVDSLLYICIGCMHCTDEGQQPKHIHLQLDVVCRWPRSESCVHMHKTCSRSLMMYIQNCMYLHVCMCPHFILLLYSLFWLGEWLNYPRKAWRRATALGRAPQCREGLPVRSWSRGATCTAQWC